MLDWSAMVWALRSSSRPESEQTFRTLWWTAKSISSLAHKIEKKHKTRLSSCWRVHFGENMRNRDAGRARALLQPLCWLWCIEQRSHRLTVHACTLQTNLRLLRRQDFVSTCSQAGEIDSICACAHLDMCTIHTYIHTCIHRYIHIYIRTYVHTYIHTYIHASMHACRHADMQT